ncbi:uncharacterized protein LOC130578458 [Malurus melanocephalus]|uniref:uncharacterized protein LOC130578458 n=1 Tax=Malurus melanocephalus TaxID=175006 RepID=UPI002546ABA3|nr:uncharacterized protein LOC130578458 [Malurus melanocephalus]
MRRTKCMPFRSRVHPEVTLHTCSSHLCTMLHLLLLLSSFSRIQGVPQTPTLLEQNIWVTLAKATGQDTLCFSSTLSQNPFTTCLVGVPLTARELQQLCNSTPAPAACMATGVWQQLPHLGKSYALPPQELDILGTLNADSCTNFKFISTGNSPVAWWVNASVPWYQNASHWCNSTTAQLTQSFSTNIQLPRGIFLICGDRAWAGVPMAIKGGPCTLGKLTLLSPNTTVAAWIQQNRIRRRHTRNVHAFPPDCRDTVEFWNAAKIISAFQLSPGVASARALTSLNKLGCSLAKISNATSIAISDLLFDADNIRHTLLQNQAAIDFLVLANGHGCKDFDQLCCMNLSDHSRSVYAQIRELQALTQHRAEDMSWNPFAGGIQDWNWLKKGLILLCVLGIVFLCMLCFIACLVSLFRFLIDSMLHRRVVRMVEYRRIPNSDYAVACVRD